MVLKGVQRALLGTVDRMSFGRSLGYLCCMVLMFVIAQFLGLLIGGQTGFIGHQLDLFGYNFGFALNLLAYVLIILFSLLFVVLLTLLFALIYFGYWTLAGMKMTFVDTFSIYVRSQTPLYVALSIVTVFAGFSVLLSYFISLMYGLLLVVIVLVAFVYSAYLRYIWVCDKKKHFWLKVSLLDCLILILFLVGFVQSMISVLRIYA
jgi:hypothetical protein